MDTSTLHAGIAQAGVALAAVVGSFLVARSVSVASESSRLRSEIRRARATASRARSWLDECRDLVADCAADEMAYRYRKALGRGAPTPELEGDRFRQELRTFAPEADPDEVFSRVVAIKDEFALARELPGGKKVRQLETFMGEQYATTNPSVHWVYETVRTFREIEHLNEVSTASKGGTAGAASRAGTELLAQVAKWLPSRPPAVPGEPTALVRAQRKLGKAQTDEEECADHLAELEIEAEQWVRGERVTVPAIVTALGVVVGSGIPLTIGISPIGEETWSTYLSLGVFAFSAAGILLYLFRTTRTEAMSAPHDGMGE